MFLRISCLLAVAAALAACHELPTSDSSPNAVSVATSVASVPIEPERVKWRFKLDADYSLHSPGVGSDGTVYVSMSDGKLYAIAPDGTQRWMIQPGLGGGVRGPVSVAADGTIYVGAMVPSPSGSGNVDAIFAITPAGTVKWEFDATEQLLIAGPNVGPDGNIYAVIQTGIGFFSLTPAGTLRFKTGSFTEHGALGEEIAFGSGQVYFAFDMGGQALPTIFAYDMNGALKFAAPNEADYSRPVVGPNGNMVIQTLGLSLTAFTPSGSQAWSFYEFPGNTEENPDVGPDNFAYTVRNLSTLFSFNENGTERWRYVDSVIMFQPRVGPRNDLLFMGGRITYGKPGLFQAVGIDGVPLWRVDLPDEPGFDPYGQLVPMTRPVFSPDGNTAYAVTDVAGDGANPYSFLYAIDVSPASPGNTTPSVTLAATSPTKIRTGGSVTMQGVFADPDQGDGPWSFTFRWGNGQTSGSAAAPGTITQTRTYSKAGTFNVRLSVTDASGAKGTSNSVTVTVK
jgi:outer membrane protein assembly factor BamB